MQDKGGRPKLKAFIETPKGSELRTRYDERTFEFKGSFRVSSPYPYNYGFIVGTDFGAEDCIDCYGLSEREM